ncbi:VOC family protein [Leptolyngbya sp. 15MV]|nr:VOC family protein [Leptolyngbya sp. 15MV]
MEDAASPIWEDDFVLDQGADDGALIGVDHAAQAVTPGMMDGFVLFYRAVFGLEPDALWELPDPFGLVRSRAFRAGAVRLPLNVSESGRTGTGRFVSALAGAGVHHIAFAARDAAAAVDAAAARNAPLLDIPENYYEDLGARLGLPDEELAALARRHLLYDRDAAGGRFRHAYTHAFRDRFFLEICDRADGYSGFGAAIRQQPQDGRQAGGLDHVVAAQRVDHHAVLRAEAGEVHLCREAQDADRAVVAEHQHHVIASRAVDHHGVRLPVAGAQVDVHLRHVGSRKVPDRDVVGAAERVEVDGLDVVQVHRHIGDVAEEDRAAAIGEDLDVLRDIRAVEQHRVEAV